MALFTFLTGLLQRFLKLINFLGELRKVVVYGITFLFVFLSSAEISSPFHPFQTYDNHECCA